MSHVADNAAVLHSVQLFSGDHILVACILRKNKQINEVGVSQVGRDWKFY